MVSVWELIIKQQLGKLTLRAPLRTILADQQANGVRILEVTLNHVLAVESLSSYHKDPFDRLLIAQAQSEGAVLLSADAIFAQYPVQVLW